MLSPEDGFLHALPKSELHVHLDGSLRPGTLSELARERDAPLPHYDTLALGAHMLVSDAASLEDYLARFALTLSVMQDRSALERIAFELAEDHARENVRYVEVRFCPVLHAEEGLGPADAVDAVLAGLARAETRHPVRTRAIVCALRTLPPRVSVEMAELAVAYRDAGVCGFDLAGAEAGYPARNHLEAFRVAQDAGLPITVHAGEGYGPASLHQAVDDAGARRIGHGTRLEEDPELMARVRERGIPLEICLTSNVQTRVADSLAEHPLRRYFDRGLQVSLCTDNRLMSGVTLTEEYRNARDHLGFSRGELVRLARMGFEHAFVEAGVRQALLEEFEGEVAELVR